MSKPRILITGALGQIGRVLVDHLIDTYGAEAVLATDLPAAAPDLRCPYRSLDGTDGAAVAALAADQHFEQVYHLVAVLSAKGEAQPWQAWDINMRALRNILTAAASWPQSRVFFPSSIAVYGPPLPRIVDESQVLRPTTSYGISKVAGELWGSYLSRTGGLDVRSLRLPGVIGYQTMPGGGTTDYAVDIYHAACRGERFSCFLAADARLPMIYMDDLMRGITEFMSVPRSKLKDDAVYNLHGFSVTPQELATSIQALQPEFAIDYQPDHRQQIAASWPAELDGSAASQDWGWQPAFDTTTTTQAMLSALRQRYASTFSL